MESSHLIAALNVMGFTAAAGALALGGPAPGGSRASTGLALLVALGAVAFAFARPKPPAAYATWEADPLGGDQS